MYLLIVFVNFSPPDCVLIFPNIRISNSEIVNLKKVKNLDLSFVGTICMELSNGDVSYVSRRYVSKIKRLLGL